VVPYYEPATKVKTGNDDSWAVYLRKKIDFMREPENMSPHDLIVWHILRSLSMEDQTAYGVVDDVEIDVDQHISPFEFINNHGRFKSSFARFDLSTEEFLDLLHEKNAQVD